MTIFFLSLFSARPTCSSVRGADGNGQELGDRLLRRGPTHHASHPRPPPGDHRHRVRRVEPRRPPADPGRAVSPVCHFAERAEEAQAGGHSTDIRQCNGRPASDVLFHRYFGHERAGPGSEAIGVHPGKVENSSTT